MMPVSVDKSLTTNKDSKVEHKKLIDQKLKEFLARGGKIQYLDIHGEEIETNNEMRTK
jgi:hypothetical protein